MKFSNHKPLYTLTLLSLIVFSDVLSANTDAKSRRKPIRITQKDKAQIIESILRKELSKKEFAKAEKYLFLSAELFSSELVPAIYKDKIEFIDSEVIKVREQRKEGVSVFFFNEFKVNRAKVIVDFGYGHYYQNYFNEEGTIYEYKKVSNRWLGRATKGRMSIAE